jgi:hypothetical protein
VKAEVKTQNFQLNDSTVSDLLLNDMATKRSFQCILKIMQTLFSATFYTDFAKAFFTTRMPYGFTLLKAIPVQALTGPEGSKGLRHLHFKTVGT